MHCALYDAGRCRSCQWLELPLTQQLADKMANLRELLAGHPSGEMACSGFRSGDGVSQQSENGRKR